jgi:adenylate cyclase
MSDIFISYARSTATQAQVVAAALRALGYTVWIDDDLPAHRTYGRVIEEQMAAAKAAVVIWSADAVQSEWVLSEANRAREDRKLVQVTADTARLPMPFDTIQCADLAGWTGDTESPGWRKVAASVAELVGGSGRAPAPFVAAPIENAPLPLPNKPSIAVLPFADPAGAKAEDYFADGIVDEITTALSRFATLFVIDSGSSLTVRNSSKSPKQIAQELGVRYLLEGGVRRSGPRVRITVQLLDTSDGAQVWGERFEGALDDVFALQDEVATAVAGQIEPNIHASEVRRIEQWPTSNLTAYHLWLRGREKIRRLSPDALAEAQQLFERAVDLDPNYGRALGLLAACLALLQTQEASQADPGLRERMNDYCDRALASAPDDPEVLGWIAHTYWLAGRDAAVLSDRALALNPNCALAWYASAASHLQGGDYQEAVARFQRHLRLDPKSPFQGYAHNLMGAAMLGLGAVRGGSCAGQERPRAQPEQSVRVGLPGHRIRQAGATG